MQQSRRDEATRAKEPKERSAPKGSRPAPGLGHDAFSVVTSEKMGNRLEP